MPVETITAEELRRDVTAFVAADLDDLDDDELRDLWLMTRTALLASA